MLCIGFGLHTTYSNLLFAQCHNIIYPYIAQLAAYIPGSLLALSNSHKHMLMMLGLKHSAMCSGSMAMIGEFGPLLVSTLTDTPHPSVCCAKCQCFTALHQMTYVLYILYTCTPYMCMVCSTEHLVFEGRLNNSHAISNYEQLP